MNKMSTQWCLVSVAKNAGWCADFQNKMHADAHGYTNTREGDKKTEPLYSVIPVV